MLESRGKTNPDKFKGPKEPGGGWPKKGARNKPTSNRKGKKRPKRATFPAGETSLGT